MVFLYTKRFDNEMVITCVLYMGELNFEIPPDVLDQVGIHRDPDFNLRSRLQMQITGLIAGDRVHRMIESYQVTEVAAMQPKTDALLNILGGSLVQDEYKFIKFENEDSIWEWPFNNRLSSLAELY